MSGSTYHVLGAAECPQRHTAVTGPLHQNSLRIDRGFGAIALVASLTLAGLIPLLFLNRQLANTWSPITLGVVCLASLFGLKRFGLAQGILSPIAWFLLACAVYYGVGPLLYIYGSDISIANNNDFYVVDAMALWRTNLLNYVSMSLILLFYSIGMSVPVFRPFRGNGDYATLIRSAHCLALIGVAFTLLTQWLRARYGDDYIMPGIFYNLAQSGLASLFLYSYIFFRGLRKIAIPFLLMTAFSGYYAIISLMKQNILELALMLFLGAFIARPAVKKLVVAACVVALGLSTLNIAVTYGRILIWSETLNRASINQLVAAFNDTDGISGLNEANEGDQSLWRRVSSSAPQAFALDAYDMGLSGHTFDAAIWAFVPRILYPGKPIITQGDVFTSLVKGAAIGGGTGPGYFGEAYWNRGWGGVLIMACYVGLLLAILNQFSNNMIATGNYQYFPVAFLALRVGYRVDDWLVAVTVSSVPIMLALAVVSMVVSLRWTGFAQRGVGR